MWLNIFVIRLTRHTFVAASGGNPDDAIELRRYKLRSNRTSFAKAFCRYTKYITRDPRALFTDGRCLKYTYKVKPLEENSLFDLSLNAKKGKKNKKHLRFLRWEYEGGLGFTFKILIYWTKKYSRRRSCILEREVPVCFFFHFFHRLARFFLQLL